MDREPKTTKSKSHDLNLQSFNADYVLYANDVLKSPAVSKNLNYLFIMGYSGLMLMMPTYDIQLNTFNFSPIINIIHPHYSVVYCTDGMSTLAFQIKVGNLFNYAVFELSNGGRLSFSYSSLWSFGFFLDIF